VLRYSIDGVQVLVIADTVLEHFRAQRQISSRSPEAGGQLFAKFLGSEAHLVLATGPRATDSRRRTSYRGDRRAEQEEINRLHAGGLHYIGDWHTHPTERPFPSAQDLTTIDDCVRRSSHELNGFVLIIVGTAPAPIGLSVSLHDGSQFLVLRPSKASDPTE
jgi:integrative and conjugative element protein (TIGR02256 family)